LARSHQTRRLFDHFSHGTRYAALELPMRFFLAFVVALATMLSVTSAFAQAAATITVINETSLPRLDAKGNQINKRAQNLTPEGISLQDCVDDQQIKFTVQMAGFDPQSSIQMWASRGGSCSEQTQRQGGTQVCWRIVPSDLARATTQDVNVRVRALLSGVASGKPAEPTDNPGICGKVDLATINVSILYFPPGQSGAKASVEKTISVTADTVGPEPPSGLTTLPGNGRIRINWNKISGGSDDGGGTGGVVALTGVKAYCDTNAGAVTKEVPNEICRDVPNEAPTDAGVDDSGDASTIEDAGTTRVCIDGGTTTETTESQCASSNFKNPDGTEKFPDRDFDSKFECGNLTGDTGQSVDADSFGGKPLQNGTQYAVAVAATDAFGNVGPLSDVKCETPAPTTDFWEAYRTAGGGAGGGCATTESAPIGTLGIIAMVLATVLRRKKDRR
jgi:hypothetical protein